jgi:cytochrome c
MPLKPDRTRRIVWALVVVLALLLVAGAIWREARKDQAQLEMRVMAMTGGDIRRGRDLFQLYGCGACHVISGVPQAQGRVGPPLEGFGGRAVIAGKLANTPANLQRWLVDPQSVTPGTAMPRLGVTPGHARDLSAFLYSRQ